MRVRYLDLNLMQYWEHFLKPFCLKSTKIVCGNNSLPMLVLFRYPEIWWLFRFDLETSEKEEL